MGRYSWQGQELDRSELRKVKQMREKGGLVSWLFECKALMKFGTGAELQSENNDLQEWLNENFERLDLLTLDLGSDGIWYPYGLGEVVETRGGEFSHIECIEPWTMLPRTNEYGEIVVWEQETQGKHNQTSPFQPEEIGSIVLNKSSGRDKVGVSEVLRSEEEITQYKENQRAVNKAIEIAGFPHHVWTVGAEGRSPVDDNDLRRVRNLIDNMDGDTQFVVGPDVDHDKITAADFDFEGVTKRDLRILTTTVGLPMELAGYGREGLGSGSETDLIGDMLALQNEVSRRRFETQFVEEFVRPVVREYSPYSEDEPIDMVIKPFLDERENVADLIGKIGEYMTNAEVREKLDLAPLEDEELAESYRPPKQIEEAEEEDQDDGMGGLFGSDDKTLQDVEDVDTVPPEGVQEQAQMALDWKEETGNPNDCGTQTGWARANQLVNGESLSEDTINRMVSFFARHEGTQEPDEPKEDCSRMMWKAWGGDAGRRWAESKQAEFENAREASDGGWGNLELVNDDTPDFDRHYLQMLEGSVWSEDTDKTLIAGSEVPEMVTDRIRETILSGAAIFSDIESIPSSELMQLREYMTETLTDQDGWTTDGLADQLMQLDGIESRDRATLIARTETASVVNTAREEAYEERGLDDARFRWVSANDQRRTDACEWLSEQTEDGVTMERLKELIEEAPTHDEDMQDDLARPENYVVHPNERSTWVRKV